MSENWKKLSRTRSQLYSARTIWREASARAGGKHPTGEFKQVADIVDSILEQAIDAWLAGEVMAVIINRYIPLALPGLEDMVDTPEDIFWDGFERSNALVLPDIVDEDTEEDNPS